MPTFVTCLHQKSMGVIRDPRSFIILRIYSSSQTPSACSSPYASPTSSPRDPIVSSSSSSSSSRPNLRRRRDSRSPRHASRSRSCPSVRTPRSAPSPRGRRRRRRDARSTLTAYSSPSCRRCRGRIRVFHRDARRGRVVGHERGVFVGEEGFVAIGRLGFLLSSGRCGSRGG